MPKVQYQDFNFRQKTLEIIDQVNDIVDSYSAKGYNLTLRQVYYQLVTKNIIENSERSYKNVGGVINDGRLAGMIDWTSIEDRTRNLRKFRHYSDMPEFIESVSRSYMLERWKGQENYVEVWVEKDALVDIVGRACNSLDTPFFSCRGYVSQSEMWSAAQRLIRMQDDFGMRPVIIHLGDHDPSGIDMSRDIEERLGMFVGEPVFLERIALNREQIDKYNPPPNPAKVTDSRARSYIKQHGTSSWELDALRPEVLTDLIKNSIHEYLDVDLYQEQCDLEGEGDAFLGLVRDNFEAVKDFVDGNFA